MTILGRSLWPAVLAGAFFVYSTTTGQMAASLTFALANTAASIIGAALIDRVAAGTNVFKSANTVFRFVALAAIVVAPISATGAAIAPSVDSAVVWTYVPYLWMTWWLAHLTAMLVVTPVVILFATRPLVRERWLEAIESVVLLAMLVGVCLVVFGGYFPSDVKSYPLEFLCVPFLLWASFRFGRRETCAAVLLLSGIAIWGTMRGFGPFARDSESEGLVLVQAYICVMSITGLVLASVVSQHKRAEIKLHELATTDSLTGLVNYRRLLEVLRTEIARSQRTNRPFAVLFLDMNGLKKVNDKYGHLVGSRGLSRIADALRRSCRAIDTPARFGGDEFAVVLPETGDEGGQAVLKRVSERLAADSTPPVVSVSGGVAVFPRDGDTPTLLLRAADKALYGAKAKSRRQAAAASEVEERKTGTLF
jgi:diguanylate cyclase (GGDEF)-like protein